MGEMSRTVGCGIFCVCVWHVYLEGDGGSDATIANC